MLSYDGLAVSEDYSTDYLKLLFKNDHGKLISFDDHIKKYEETLYNDNLSGNTIGIYLHTVTSYYKEYGQISKTNLLAWKQNMIDIKKNKPATVNLRVISMNRYLLFCKKYDLRLREVKSPSKNFLDKVVTLKQYQKLKSCLLRDNKKKLYNIICVFGVTGVRVSELIKLNVGDIKEGQADIHSKGDRIRRVYIPKNLRIQLLDYLKEEGRSDADDLEPLFLNKNGVRMATRGVQSLVHSAGISYNIPGLHCHAFRHMFAYAWLDQMSRTRHKNGNIEYGVLPMLAEILGHKSLNTVMIYLKPGSEQLREYAEKINW